MPDFETEPREPFGTVLLEIEVPSQLSFKDPIIIRMLRLLSVEGYLNRDDSKLVQLVMDEAVKNAMMHGNQFREDLNVGICLFVDEENWGIIITDHGKGMKPEYVPPPLETPDEVRESGYGIVLMDSVMKDVVFTGEGNELFMSRKRSAVVEGEEAFAAQEINPLSEEEAEQTGYIVPVSERDDLVDSLDFDESTLGTAAEAEAIEEAIKEPAPTDTGGIEGAEVQSETDILRVYRMSGTLVMQLLARQINDSNLKQVQEQLRNAMEGEAVGVLEMSHVNWVSSVVLGAFVNLNKEVTSRNAELRFCNLSDTIVEVFKITRLDTVFSVYADHEAAIRGDEE